MPASIEFYSVVENIRAQPNGHYPIPEPISTWVKQLDRIKCPSMMNLVRKYPYENLRRLDALLVVHRGGDVIVIDALELDDNDLLYVIVRYCDEDQEHIEKLRGFISSQFCTIEEGDNSLVDYFFPVAARC